MATWGFQSARVVRRHPPAGGAGFLRLRCRRQHLHGHSGRKQAEGARSREYFAYNTPPAPSCCNLSGEQRTGSAHSWSQSPTAALSAVPKLTGPCPRSKFTSVCPPASIRDAPRLAAVQSPLECHCTSRISTSCRAYRLSSWSQWPNAVNLAPPCPSCRWDYLFRL